MGIQRPRVVPNITADKPIARRTRSFALPPRVVPIDVPPPLVAHRTRSCKISPVAASARIFPFEFISRWAVSKVLHGSSLSVLDVETGKSLEHRVLRWHPHLSSAWGTAHSNELGCLCQGIGTDPNDHLKKRVEGTDTFHVLRYKDIPLTAARASPS